MTITGTVSVSGVFTDLTSMPAVESLQMLSLASRDTVSGGKAIVVSGIADASGGVTIDPSDTGFRNAAGDEVSLTGVSRVLFTANPGATARFGSGAVILKATGGRVAASCCVGAGDKNVKVTATAGTSTYALIMWQAD